MEYISKIFGILIEPVSVIFILVLLLFINSWIFKTIRISKENITKGVISFLLIIAGAIAFILVLPIEKELKGQVLGFLGIIFSAGIALSSTTVLGNFIAGIMNNSMKRFRNGDLIKINDFHGRVTKKSIFHIEIQLEDSNFITIPNLYIASNPVKLTKKSNTIISTSVSLGYDVSRKKIEKALIDAAISVGLKEPYVYIKSLGDFSIVYKIHGFLEDSNKFFSATSLLNAKVIDELHAQKIEIVSPNFMNQRRVDEQTFIPKQLIIEDQPSNSKLPEELIFEEAIESEKIEIKKDRVEIIEQEQKELKKELKKVKDKDEVEKIKAEISKKEEIKEDIEEDIEKKEDEQSK